MQGTETISVDQSQKKPH